MGYKKFCFFSVLRNFSIIELTVVAEQSQTANHSTVVESNEGEGRKFVVKQLLGSDHWPSTAAALQWNRINVKVHFMLSQLLFLMSSYCSLDLGTTEYCAEDSYNVNFEKKILAGPITSIFLSSLFWWGNLSKIVQSWRLKARRNFSWHCIKQRHSSGRKQRWTN